MSAVNHPHHYGGEDNPYEAIKIIEALGFGEGFCAGNALKYMVRAGAKDPAKKQQDLEKAAWYLNRWIEGDYTPVIPEAKYKYADIVERAQIFALKRHAGQMYGDLPYAYHLFKVVQVLERYGITNPTILTAGWLHDVLEDTETTPQELIERFGVEVTELVSRVTDDNSISGRTNKKADVYTRINMSPWESLGKDSLIVKLADRIANVEACYSGSQKLTGEGRDKCTLKYTMYKTEQPALHAAFADRIKTGTLVDHMFLDLEVLFHESPTL